MAGGPSEGRAQAARYAPLFSLLDDGARIHDGAREAVHAIELLEGQLAALLADPRVARRLRRETRRRERSSHIGRPAEAPTAARPDGQPSGMRPPSKAAVERHAALLEDLAAVSLPAMPEELARLQGRLAGVPAPATFRAGPAVVRGATETLESPRPQEVPEHLMQVLQWAQAPASHPVLTAAVLAGEVLAICPFKDNEPMLSRLLMRLILHNNGLGTAAELALDARIDLGAPLTLDRLITACRDQDALPWLLHVAHLLRDVLEETLADARFAARHVDALNDRQWRLAEWFRRLHEADGEANWRFRDVQAVFDSVPARTLKRDLATLRDNALLIMDGKLKSARYRWNGTDGPAGRSTSASP